MDEQLTLVLMAGLPGAGKSALACALKDSLRWDAIDKDTYKLKLLNQGMNEEKAGRKAYKWSFETAYIKLALQKKCVILDSAAREEFILENARHIVACTPNAQLKVILCVADCDIRNQRIRTRPSQITNIKVDPTTRPEYLELFRHLQDEDSLILLTNEPLETYLTEAVNFLLSPPSRKSEHEDRYPSLAGAR